MKLLVTGSKGFIGSHAIPYFESKGHQVLGVDLDKGDGPNYARADITSQEEVEMLFSSFRPEMVVHMAGEVGRIQGEEHPSRMVYVNEVGTLRMILSCMKYDAKLVYFSTSEVYGTSFDGKTMTEDIPLKAFETTNIYSLTKLFGEAMVKHYVENYGLLAVGIRPFMLYGPWEYATRYRSALIQFIRAAIENRPLIVHKNTERAWCHVRDFIEGLELVMKKATFNGYEAFNIGSEEYYTMEQVAATVLWKVGGGSIQLVEPPDKFLTLKKHFSIEKMKALGYSPKIKLDKGIDEILESMKVANR